MDTLPNVNTRRGGNKPSHAGLTSNVSPKVQSPEAENSHTGVTSDFVPKENHEWFVLRATYGRSEMACNELREKGIKAGLFRPITIRPLAVKPLRAAVSRAKQILFTESANGQLAQMVLEKLYGLNTPYETLFKMGVGVTGDDIVSKVEGMLCKV